MGTIGTLDRTILIIGISKFCSMTMRNRTILLNLPILALFLDGGLAFDPSEFLVKGLGKIEPAFDAFEGTMYAGLLPIDVDIDGDKNEPRGELSFWFFAPNEASSVDSLTIWLNGGPGCSSFAAGMMMECSPVTTPHYSAGHGLTDAHQPLIPNEYSWTKATNLLFVEQPTGVGFSHGPIVDSEADVANNFYNFLVNFFDTFQNMKSKSLYIVGESYAGMYVPSIAHYIHKQNKKEGHTKKMNLSGIALGNGWIDGMVQGPTVIDYAYWHGMIDSTAKETLYKVWGECKNNVPLKTPFHEYTTPDECNILSNVMAAAGAGIFPKREYYAPNAYDVTTCE
jgi:carboxypeptidase C (cathepsin A)